MTTWKIFVTFFQNLYDDHYTPDDSFDRGHFTFVKVNDRYPLALEENRLPYDIFVEHDFEVYRPELQANGYCENSVIYHLYKNGVHRSYDYVGFIEYDHVLPPDFTRTIGKKLEEAKAETIFSFNRFSYRQLFDQAIMLNPHRREKVTGRPASKWNCINVILEDYNDFFGTDYGLDRLVAKDCFPICHCVLMPSRIFEKIMPFHTRIMESGKVEGYHRHNWRAPAGFMERYLAVALALEDAPIDDAIQLEHRSLPVKVLKPEGFEPSAWRKVVAYINRKL